jgi:hypothetical protein
MFLRRFAILPFVLLTFSTVGLAQKADVSFVAGGAFVSESRVPSGIAVTCTITCPTAFTFKTDTHVFYAGTGAVRLANFKLVSLHFEVPVAGIPSAPIVFSGSPASTGLKLSSVFVTPSLRVKFAPGAPVSPFASFGGGWARYSLAGPATNKGALQFGGGVDIKTRIPLLGFRAEVRDFVSGQPEFANVSAQTFGSSSNGWRHNVLAGGGIVLRF